MQVPQGLRFKRNTAYARTDNAVTRGNNKPRRRAVIAVVPNEQRPPEMPEDEVLGEVIASGVGMVRALLQRMRAHAATGDADDALEDAIVVGRATARLGDIELRYRRLWLAPRWKAVDGVRRMTRADRVDVAVRVFAGLSPDEQQRVLARLEALDEEAPG